MAVIKSKNAKKYSINAFSLLFLTKFLIDEPKAAQGDIDNGQIIKAIDAIPDIVSPLTNEGFTSVAVAILIMDKISRNRPDTITKFDILYI